jgi:hypothetical protein
VGDVEGAGELTLEPRVLGGSCSGRRGKRESDERKHSCEVTAAHAEPIFRR